MMMMTDDALDLEPLPPSSPSYSPRGLTLRPYQLDCIAAVLDTLKQGHHTRIGVSAPTGSGKTSMFTALIQLLPELVHVHGDDRTRGRQVLILLGSIVLAQQAAASVRRTWPDLTVEIEQGSNMASGWADVTVATFQTLAYNDFARLDKFDPKLFKAVIIDEAHHAVAPSYLRILERFDPRLVQSPEPEASDATSEETQPIDLDLDAVETSPIVSIDQHLARSTSPQPDSTLQPLSPMPARIDPVTGRSCVPLLAFTATFERADGLALGRVFEKIVWHAEWLAMIRGKWLSPLRFTTLHLGSDLDLSRVPSSNSSGDYVMASLAREVDKTEVNRRTVEAWWDKARDRHSTLVFAVNIHHILSLTNAFRTELGVEAAFVHQGIPQREREITYERFRSGEVKVLVNCGILTEGADFPAIDCILLCRPTCSRNLFLQMIGRGLRLSPDTGKRDCLVIDLVGNSGQGLICAPTLFGIDAKEEIEDQTIEQLEARALAQETRDAADAEAAAARADATSSSTSRDVQDRSTAYRDYDTIFDLVEELGNKPMSIRMLSRNAWVGTGAGSYVLELIGKGYVKVVKEADGPYSGAFYRRLPSGTKPPYAKPAPLISHSDLSLVIRSIDAKAGSDSTMKSKMDIRHSALWRQQPITPSQEGRILARLAKPRAEDGYTQRMTIDAVWVPGPGRRRGQQIDVRLLNKGEASDLICRLTHGGMGSMKKVIKNADKSRAREEKDSGRAERAKARKAMRSSGSMTTAVRF